MKTSIRFLPIALILVAFFIRAQIAIHPNNNADYRQAAIVIPTAVKAVIDNKCYICHSSEGKSEKARAKLMWDSIPLYPKAKQIAKLGDIVDVLDKGEMPPKKMVEMNPKAALTPEEAKTIRDWASSAADQLMK